MFQPQVETSTAWPFALDMSTKGREVDVHYLKSCSLVPWGQFPSGSCWLAPWRAGSLLAKNSGSWLCSSHVLHLSGWIGAATFLYAGLFLCEVHVLFGWFISSRACWGLSELDPFCHLLFVSTVGSGQCLVAPPAVPELGDMPGVARCAAVSGRAAEAGVGSGALCWAHALLGWDVHLEGHSNWGAFEWLCIGGHKFLNGVMQVWAIRKRKDTWILNGD